MLSQSIDVVVGGKGGTKLQVLISKLHYKKCACGRLCGVWCVVCGVCVWCGVCVVCGGVYMHVARLYVQAHICMVHKTQAV